MLIWIRLTAIVLLALATGARAEDFAGAAYSTCQMFALDHLPGAARTRFPSLGEPGTFSRERGSADFQVGSYVDVGTDAGERDRSRVYCDLRQLGTNHWELERIFMGHGDRAALEREKIERWEATASSLRRQALIQWVAAGFDPHEIVPSEAPKPASPGHGSRVKRRSAARGASRK